MVYNQMICFTKFEVWLMEYGILPIHCRSNHPQTHKYMWFPDSIYGHEYKNSILLLITSCQLEQMDIFVRGLACEAKKTIYNN